MEKIVRYWRIFATLPILLYQKTLSLDHGFLKNLFPYGYCRFYPTCSEYTRLAIRKYGVAFGILKGCYRVLRCNPWNKGGVDQP